MRTTLISKDKKKGIPPTLYDARLNFNQINNVPSMFRMKSHLLNIDKNIGYAHVISDNPVFDDNSLSKYGLQMLGSPLSYQLPAVDINFFILSNLGSLPDLHDISIEEFPDCLPVISLDWDFNIFENASSEKKELLQTLMITHIESQVIEKTTRKQRESIEWQQYRKNRLTSTSAHKVFIRKKNFNTLAKQLNNPKPFNEQIEIVKQALNHGENNEVVAKEKYRFIMNYRLLRNVKVKEVGLLIQNQLFWLGASPDGVIFDKQNIPHVGLLEIKCPYTKKIQKVSVYSKLLLYIYISINFFLQNFYPRDSLHIIKKMVILFQCIH